MLMSTIVRIPKGSKSASESDYRAIELCVLFLKYLNIVSIQGLIVSKQSTVCIHGRALHISMYLACQRSHYTL